MKKRRIFRIAAFLTVAALLLSAAFAASAMEIIVDEYHSPSEDLVGPDEGIADEGIPYTFEVMPTPAPADFSGLWIGEYVLADDPDSTLSITPGEGGRLHLSAFFLRMTGIEAEIIPYDDRAIRFSDNDGAYDGGIHREPDGSIRLAVSGGGDMGPGSAMRDFFLMNDFYFVKPGQTCSADPGDQLRRLTGEDLTNAGLEDEKYQITDRYTIRDGSALSSWEHTEYDGTGSRTIRRSGSSMTVEEYDAERRKIRRTDYDTGVIRTSEIYSYDTEGRQTCTHTVEYGTDGLSHSFDYFDYDAAGRQTVTRKYASDGQGGIYERYEYFDDGSKAVRYYTVFGRDAGKQSGEAWYDAGGRQIRTVSYVDGALYNEQQTEYMLDINGRVIQESIVSTFGDGRVYRTIREKTYGENGRLVRQTETSPDYMTRAVSEYLSNSKGQPVSQYTLNEYLGGGSTSVSAMDTEFEYDVSSVRQLVTRHYEYSSDLYAGTRRIVYTYYDVYEGNQGTRLGISPLPRKGTGEVHTLIPDDFAYTFRDMTREDVTRSFHARRTGECIYDSEDLFELGGYTGTLRFVFESRGSNRLQSVWWVCSGDPDAVWGLQGRLAEEGVEWTRSSGWEKPDAVGLTETTGEISEGVIRLAIGFRGGQALAYVTCAYAWYEPEAGLALPWENHGNTAYVPDAESAYETATTQTPVDENGEAGAFEPEITLESAAEPEPVPNPESAPAPEPESEAPGEPEIPAGEWVGCWMSGGDETGELVTYLKEDGSLWMKAIFLRTFEIEAELKPLDSNRCTFETEYGHYSGVVNRVNERELRFAVTGGMSMEDDENEYYYMFRDREFVFSPVDYNDLWYEAPAEEPEDDSDWTGNWTAAGTEMKSTIRIIRGMQGNYIMQLAFSNGYMIAGELEKVDSRRMDFDADEFGAILTLNRKHRMIMLTDAGSMNDAANEALDAFHYMIEYSPEVYE